MDWHSRRCFPFLGRFIKDIADQNTLKIVDVQFDDGGSYVCRASTELDFDEASATLVVQDRPNRPRITKVNCSGSTQNTYGQPFAIVQWEATGRQRIYPRKNIQVCIQVIIMHEFSIMNYNTIHHFNKMIGSLFPWNNVENRIRKSNHRMDRLN